MTETKTLVSNAKQPNGHRNRLIAMAASLGWLLVLSSRLSAFGDPFAGFLMLLAFVIIRKTVRNKFWIPTLGIGILSLVIGIIWWTLPFAYAVFFIGFYANELADKLMKKFNMPVR